MEVGMKSVLILLLISGAVYADPVTPVKQIIIEEAQKQGLDPSIALAIADVESHTSTKAIGGIGELGLFQIRPEFVAIPAYMLFDARTNARLGIQQLIYWRSHCPTNKNLDWIGCFNQGHRNPKFPKELPYYKKVMRSVASQ